MSSPFAAGDRVEHKYGLATVLEILASGVSIRFDAPVADLDGELEDTVSAEDLRPIGSTTSATYSDAEIPEIIRKHLDLLFEPGDRICFTFIHATNKTRNGAAVTDNHCLPLSKATSHKCIERLQLRNAEGWNIYLANNPLIPGADRRRKELAGTPRNVFMEVDENGEHVLLEVLEAADAKEIPPPTVILKSSPGKYQFIWRIISEEFSMEKIEALNAALVSRFGGDPACTDQLRVFRLPVLVNHKYETKPVVEVVEITAPEKRWSLADFHIEIGPAKKTIVKPEADQEELVSIVNYVEQAAEEAKISLSPLRKWGSNGYLWDLTCPWVHEHTGAKDSGTVIILHKSGALDFVCRHGHCVHRTWADFRAKLEELAGHQLTFGDPKTKPGDIIVAGPATSVPIPADEVASLSADLDASVDGSGDWSEEVLDGRLGEICKIRLLCEDRFPISYAWPALLAAAGTMVPTVPHNPGIVLGEPQTNLFVGLVGPVHSGKSQAILWARGVIGLPLQLYSEIRAASSEALLKKLHRMRKNGGLPKSLLIDLDEWKHLFDKAGIEHASFCSFLQTAFYKRTHNVVLAGGYEVELECALTLIGGIVQDEFADCFGVKSMGGLHDRFLFGLCPEGYNFLYRPFDGGLSASIQCRLWCAPMYGKWWIAFVRKNRVLAARRRLQFEPPISQPPSTVVQCSTPRIASVL